MNGRRSILASTGLIFDSKNELSDCLRAQRSGQRNSQKSISSHVTHVDYSSMAKSLSSVACPSSSRLPYKHEVLAGNSANPANINSLCRGLARVARHWPAGDVA